MARLDLSIIVAMTQTRVIGNNGKLPWQRLPSDMARFRRITMEVGPMLMGRVTYESIISRNGQPLPGRKHIVLTRKFSSSPNESVKFVGSAGEACREVTASGGRACVIGGGEIFEIFLPLATKAYITIVHAPELSGDVYFPKMDIGMGWRRANSSPVCKWNPSDEYETSFELYKRF